MDKADQRYLKTPIEIPLVYLETLDGHGKSQVFSIAHVRGSTVIVDSTDAYVMVLKSVSSRYDLVGLAYLGKKS